MICHGDLVGVFPLSDDYRIGVAEANREVRSIGISLVMLTGDNEEAGRQARTHARTRGSSSAASWRSSLAVLPRGKGPARGRPKGEGQPNDDGRHVRLGGRNADEPRNAHVWAAQVVHSGRRGSAAASGKRSGGGWDGAAAGISGRRWKRLSVAREK
jgi:hypothetical protein